MAANNSTALDYASNQLFDGCATFGLLPRLTSMTEDRLREPGGSLRTPPERPIQRVEVSFVGAPPAHRVERASGVSDVEVDGPILRCIVSGSFQPFLEALRGHEVIGLKSVPTHVCKRG
jgi:hypothetical protein